MTGNTTLRDIQSVVFENIPGMLEELDTAEHTKAHALAIPETPNLNALHSRRGSGGGRGGRGAWRGGHCSGPASTSRFPAKTKSDKLFCRMCFLAVTEPQVHTSHEIGRCSRLTIADMESLKGALVLNSMITVTEAEDDNPDYFLQPGWDDVEAEQLQTESADQE